MADQSALLRAFADYARTISRPYDIGEVLYRLTDQIVQVLGVDGAGVSIADVGAELRFVTATDERVAVVEEMQAELHDGPCHDAFLSGEPVVVTDLTHEERWPRYRPVALEEGFAAVMGIPMLAADERIGALNVYHGGERPWSEGEQRIAQVLADMTTGYIVNARTLSEQRELAGQLQHALDSRVVIEQAKGILAERHRVDTGSAFRLLRQHARARNARVHDLASEVVDGRTLG